MTLYKILFKDNGHWEEGYPNVQASSSRAAVRKTVEDKETSDREGEFLAIPARSFKPVTVKVERTVRIGS